MNYYTGFEADLPKHECELILMHNPHKSDYATIEEYIENSGCPWVSEEQRLKAIATQSVWALHWYPSTPIGFIHYAACDLQALIYHCKDMV